MCKLMINLSMYFFKYLPIFVTYLSSHLLMKETTKNDLLNNSNYENYLLKQSTLYQNQSPEASWTMQLSFENNASMSLLTILDIKLEEYDHDDFWADMYDRPIVKYGLTSFTIFTLVFLTPYIYISLMFIHQKHFK